MKKAGGKKERSGAGKPPKNQIRDLVVVDGIQEGGGGVHNIAFLFLSCSVMIDQSCNNEDARCSARSKVMRMQDAPLQASVKLPILV